MLQLEKSCLNTIQKKEFFVKSKKYKMYFADAALLSLLAGCGGGGGNANANVGDLPVTPFKVVDFAQGRFSIVGETVVKPNFSNTADSYCITKRSSAAVDADLAATSFHCNVVSGSGPIQDWSNPFVLSSANNGPAHLVGTAIAGKSLDVDMTGVGSVISNLKSGESYGYGRAYSWSNFIGTNTTKFDFSYKSANSAVQTGLLAATTNKVDIVVTLYRTDSFGQTKRSDYPVVTKQYAGDFTDSVTVDPKTYDLTGVGSIGLTVGITHLIKFTRTN
jgi:hypothetical protein